MFLGFFFISLLLELTKVVTSSAGGPVTHHADSLVSRDNIYSLPAGWSKVTPRDLRLGWDVPLVGFFWELCIPLLLGGCIMSFLYFLRVYYPSDNNRNNVPMVNGGIPVAGGEAGVEKDWTIGATRIINPNIHLKSVGYSCFTPAQRLWLVAYNTWLKENT
jgi:hypothetical protein